MAADYPPLNKFYIASYAANDRSYPILAIRLDPRTAGYRVPEDLSPHPDSKRYPNHVFTGAQPSSGDQVVTHVYEILPSPWVPFTRYDDDLGPIQGRRRAVKNESQQADLTSSTKISYEGREGSAIVSNEIEETWSIKTDEDGNSLFPLKDRDFYDASRGAVQERRQLFVPTGEEEGTLENVNGVITQTSYEPYNEFLSVKIVQTYKVDGPQLIGQATDNDGQLVTVTTQRKGADGYIPPSPTATRTIEINREDAESLIERVVDTPEIFTAKTFSVERPDPIPQKFRVAVPLETDQEVVEGVAEIPVLQEGDISRTEEQRNKFLKRVSSTSRDQTVLPQTLIQKATDNDRQEVTITETLQVGNTNEAPTATKTIESDALGDGNYVIRKTEVPEVFSGKTFQKTKDDLTPQKFRGAQESETTEETVAGIAKEPELDSGQFVKSEQQINKFVKRVSTTSRAITSAVTLNEKILTPEGLVGSRVLTLASGNQAFTPSATLIDASVEALGDGRTVKTETTIPKIFAGKSITKSRIDLTPEKFKAKQEDVTTEESVVGAISPLLTLQEGEFRKSEQQVTEFVKRKSTTTRDLSATTDLEELIVTPQGQLATRKLILSSGEQTIQPDGLLIDGSVEALGDGRTIKTEVRVGEVFGGLTISKERQDNIPTEFRAEIPSITEEKTITGNVNSVFNLDDNEISKSEQQITEFLKRVRTTTRNDDNEINISGEEIDENGIKSTVVRTLSNGIQSISPSATVSGRVEALGGGKSVKTQIEASSVFNEKTQSKRQTLLPNKFYTNQTTTSEIIEKQNAQAPEIGNGGTGVIESSEQRTTAFKVRRTETNADVKSSLTGNVFTTELGGGVATVTETVGGDIEPAFGTISSEREAIGETHVTREVKLNSVPTLFGQEYDEELDITIPYSQFFGASGTSGPRKRITPRDVFHSQVTAFDVADIQEQLDSYFFEVPDMIEVALPDKLLSVKLETDFDLGEAESNAAGDTYSLTESRRSSSAGTISYEIEEGFRGVVPATRLIFFLPKGQASPQQVLSRSGASRFWPNLRPKSRQFVIIEKSNYEEKSNSVSFDSSAISTSKGFSFNTKTAVIPPAINDEINIEFVGSGTNTVECRPDKIEKSGATGKNFPTGKFLYRINATPYKFSYIRIDAIVVEITDDYN